MITKVKFKQQDGTWSENIPIGVEAQNVEINFNNKSINLADYVIQNNNLQTELKEENTNLFNAMPEVKGQGTNIVLQETSRNKYKQPPFPEGNSWQTSLTGKNLFPLQNKYLDNEEYTVTLPKSLSAGNYTFATNLTGTTNATSSTYGCTVRFLNENTTVRDIQVIPNDGRKVVAVSLSDVCDKIMLRPWYSGAGGVDCKMTYSNIELDEGTTDGSYEEYCGGVASPNPPYPQNIHNVSGNVNVVVGNKNLFDKDNTTLRANSYINYSTGAIGGTQNTNYTTEDYIEIEASTIYTLANATSGMRLAFYDENETYISGKNNTFIGFTTPSNAKYIRFSDVDLSKVMLLKGNTNETTYTPHEQQTLPFTLEQGQKMYLGSTLKDDGIHHVRYQYAFTGQENFARSGTYTTATSFCCNTGSIRPRPRKLKTASDTVTGFLTIGKAVRIGSINTYNTCFAYNTNDLHFLKIKNTAIPNWDDSATDSEKVTLFKAYLAQQYNNNTPVIVEYELDEELIEPYTSTQQAQYNAIKKAYSYKDTTIITLSSDDADPLTNVVAVADMSIKISNIENKLALL